MDTTERRDPVELRAMATRWRKLAAATFDQLMARAIIEQAEALETTADLIEGKRPTGPKP